jgi:hypothetical protein
MLAWIPESLLNEKGTTEWEKFIKIEEHSVLDDEDDGALTELKSSSLANAVQMLCSSTCPSSARSPMPSLFRSRLFIR